MADQPPAYTDAKDRPGTAASTGSGTKSSGSGASPSGSGTFNVLTPSQITNLATSEADQSIASQTAPYTTDISTYQGQSQRATDAINDMFGSILPYVQGSAQQVQGSYDTALGAESQIMNAAMTRLNQLKQQRAQDAQTMAQQIGGPVALGEFTAGLDDQGSLLANLSAGQLLHTLGYAQAGVQEAQAFAGKVFPLVQTEQVAQSKAHYQDLIDAAQKNIDQIKAQKGDLVNQRVDALTAQNQQYAIQVAQQKLDSLKAAHDWAATKHQLTNDDKRVKMAQQQFALTKTAQTTNTKLEWAKLDAAKKQAAAQLGLSKAELAQRDKQLQASTKYQNARLAAAERQQWAGYLDAATSGGAGKSVKVTNVVPTTLQMALKDPKNSYQGKDGKWYHIVSTQQQVGATAPITGPNNLVDYLVAHAVPKNVAVNMVKARLKLPSDWQYGDANPAQAAAVKAARARAAAAAKARAGRITGNQVDTGPPPGKGVVTTP